IAETATAFERLERDGKIRSWGVSNFDVPELEEALAAAGPGRIACNQVLYNLGERAIEHAVLPWCEKHGVALVGYSPFGHGDFPGKDTAGGRALAGGAAAHDATPRQGAPRLLVPRAPLVPIPPGSSPRPAPAHTGARR